MLGMMRSPTLADLPTPPPGKSGWPWTVDTPSLPETRPDGSPWPRISIVTPSYNQGQFIEETIRSVLLQGYPDLEYIIMDGGSTDESVDIIKKYAPWLAHWESARDKGQADAINKGFSRITGSRANWVNSDDVLLPGCLELVGSSWGGASCLAGAVENRYDEAMELMFNTNLSSSNLVSSRGGISFHQPGVWMLRECLDKCLPISGDLHYYFDRLLLIEYLYAFPEVEYVAKPMVAFRIHAASKTSNVAARYADEYARMLTLIANESRWKGLRGLARAEIERRFFMRFAPGVLQGNGSRMSKLCALVKNAPSSMLLDRYFLGTLRRAALGNGSSST